MDGVTGMLAWLSHVPVGSRVGLYWPANIDFRFVSELRLQRANDLSPLELSAKHLCATRIFRMVSRTATKHVGT